MLFEGKRVEVGAEHEASVHRRAGAWLLDALLVVLIVLGALRLLMIATSPRGAVVHLRDVNPWWVPPVAVGLWILYRALMESGGGTVGKRVFGIHVRHEEGGRVGLFRAAVRAVTAPFDAVLGHLEREGPFDRRQNLRVVKRRGAGLVRWIAPGFWIALASFCAVWLLVTSTSSLVAELTFLQTKNRCGQIPREVIRFTDRSGMKASRRCDAVMQRLIDRAEGGDRQARATLGALPHARDWGYPAGQ